MQRLRLILSIWLAAAALSACVSPAITDPEAVGGTPADARALVGSWFAAARAGAGDRGWSLIHPDSRQSVIGTEAEYVKAVKAVDWSSFTYEVADVSVFDGQYRIEVLVPGGKAGTPRFMLDWGVIQFPSAGDRTDRGIIFVRIPPDQGPEGILVG